MDWLFFSPVISEQLQLQGIDPSLWMLLAYVAWLGVSAGVAFLAGRKGLNKGIVFVISAAVSPLAGLLYILFIKDHAAEAGLLRAFGKTWMKPVTLILLVAPF